MIKKEAPLAEALWAGYTSDDRSEHDSDSVEEEVKNSKDTVTCS